MTPPTEPPPARLARLIRMREARGASGWELTTLHLAAATFPVLTESMANTREAHDRIAFLEADNARLTRLLEAAWEPA